MLNDANGHVSSHNTIRAQIFHESALLTWKITELLNSKSAPPSDGPSSDDFSTATLTCANSVDIRENIKTPNFNSGK